MAGAVLVADVGIVLGALVDILDHQHDRRAGGDGSAGAVILEHARQDLHLVGFLPLGGEARLAGPPLVKEALDIGGCQRNVGRAAIDNAAKRRPMAFAKGGDAEQMTE